MKPSGLFQKSETLSLENQAAGSPGAHGEGGKQPNQAQEPKRQAIARFFRNGDPWVWACGAATAVVLLLFTILVLVVAFHGLRAFWTPTIHTFEMADGARYHGAINGEEPKENRVQLYIGNRDLYGLDYRWIDRENVTNQSITKDLVLLERVEKGNFIGTLKNLNLEDETGSHPASSWESFRDAMARMDVEMARVKTLGKKLGSLNRDLEDIRLDTLKADKGNGARMAALQARMRQKQDAFEKTDNEWSAVRNRLRKQTATFEDAGGRTQEIAIMDIVRAYRPNTMSFFDKWVLYGAKVKELLTGYPRESNTEGGLFPAIFGTVLMVMLMSVFGVPLGVVAAVYLREYAKEGMLVNLVRIAVNNLAGVPSIVYGMFGLGFFVYGIGGTIDDLFFPERLPIPTFGTGGLLWASLTMALLTVPVVIVSTEEGLNSVPQGVRDGSLALGATKLQTLLRVVLPMATPGILTGLILAIARAAGEVAPLMLVGVVKIVPSLPVEGEFPYLHLERKFMHLGFHIFDVGFQSPNVEAAMPMVYVTTLLLLVLVLGMSFLAMYLRNRMKKRYMTGAF